MQQKHGMITQKHLGLHLKVADNHSPLVITK